MHEEVRVTVIATGFEGFELTARAPEILRRERERETPPFVRRNREARRGAGERAGAGAGAPGSTGRDETLGDLKISDAEIDVPDFLK
jgi:hypothetical protein